MASRLASLRGPQHFLALTALLVAAVLALNYWRLAGTNSDLQDRIHRLQQLLDLNGAQQARLEAELRLCKESSLKAAEEQQHLQQEREMSVQRQAVRLDSADCGQQARQHEQELAAAQERLETARANLTRCLSQKCGDRVKELQFDLDTCRFARKHAGHPGIVRSHGEGAGSRGAGQLPLLSPGAVSVHQPALRGMHYQRGPILLTDPPDSYRPPPLLSVAGAAQPGAPGAGPPEHRPDEPPAAGAPAAQPARGPRKPGSEARPRRRRLRGGPNRH